MRHTIFTALFLLAVSFGAQAAEYLTIGERKSFIKEYAEIAVREMHRTNIPASIKLAQFILESSWGKGELFLNANAGFGVKRNGSQGPVYAWKDDDYDANGNLIDSDFRMYKTVEESFFDHSTYLVTRGIYDELFDLGRYDYRGWAIGLQRKGYATDKQYAQKLIKLIEDYELNFYDFQPNPNAVPTPSVQATTAPRPTVPQVVVRPVAVPQPVVRAEPAAPTYQIIERPQTAPQQTKPQPRKKRSIPRHYRATSYKPMRMF